jgi:large subunit ribosomal protein L17
MRHRIAGKRLGRTTSHRKATMKALTVALFTHDAIETTVTKAKELRRFAEPLITMAKIDTVANRRRAFAALGNNQQASRVVKKLFGELGPHFADRPGGYTRVLKMHNRLGDAAQMSRIELVGLGEYEEDDDE